MSAQQLPAGRPWFRLASLARMEAAAAASTSNPPPATQLATPQPPPLQVQPSLAQPSPKPYPPPPPPPAAAEPPKVISTPPSIAKTPSQEPEPPKTISVAEQSKSPNGKEISRKSNGKAKDEGDKRLITIAGENIGATMEFGFGSKSEEKNNGKEKGRELAEKMKPKVVMVNSNVQSINSSIVLNATCKQHSPGVHVNFAGARQLNGSASH